MAKPGTLLSMDRHLLIDALSALDKGKTEVVKEYIEAVLRNMNKADSYMIPQKNNVRNIRG